MIIIFIVFDLIGYYVYYLGEYIYIVELIVEYMRLIFMFIGIKGLCSLCVFICVRYVVSRFYQYC